MRNWIAAFLALLLSAGVALAEKRVALVMGNSNYANATPLLNPVNDATDLAAALIRLDFDVLLVTNLDQTAMRRAVRAYAERLVGADVALFFYAGHAVQVDGQNFLAPIDTDLQKESDLDFETISLEFIQRQMQREAKTQLVFLDACRNNPLTRQLVLRSRSLGDTKGLAPFEASGEGTFIAFATQPENVALDGEGRNSPFSKALLANIERPGVEISTMMTDVRRAVYDSTGGNQLPWTNSSLLGHFYFNPAEPAAAASQQDTARLDKLARLEAEAQLWEGVKDSRDAAAIRDVIAKLSEDGPYSELARSRLAALEVPAPAATPPVVAPQVEQPKAESAQGAASEPPAREEPPQQVARAEIEPPALPEPEQKPDRELIRSVQEQLERLGCDPGTPDGVWGGRSRSALGEFSRHGKLELTSLEPSATLLDELAKREGRICPISCGRNQVEKDGQCVAVAPPPAPAKTASAPRRTNRVQGGSNCFRFNGQLVCD